MELRLDQSTVLLGRRSSAPVSTAPVLKSSLFHSCHQNKVRGQGSGVPTCCFLPFWEVFRKLEAHSFPNDPWSLLVWKHIHTSALLLCFYSLQDLAVLFVIQCLPFHPPSPLSRLLNPEQTLSGVSWGTEWSPLTHSIIWSLSLSIFLSLPLFRSAAVYLLICLSAHLSNSPFACLPFFIHHPMQVFESVSCLMGRRLSVFPRTFSRSLILGSVSGIIWEFDRCSTPDALIRSFTENH